MSVGAAQLIAEVKIVGDAEAKQKLTGVNEKVKETSGGFKSMLGNALSFASGQAIFTGVGDAIGFLKDQTEDAFHAALDHQQIMTQTIQALKSTKDASGETAAGLQLLAEKFSALTPFSEDAIQSTENLELTFTNISKAVFPEATQAILDVSQAMGQDLKSSAIQVGKALGDPLTGMTALQRIGVTFSTSEKDQIKTMMAHNNIIGAQKVILHELATEFGGSATAAGKTFGGQMDILNNKFEDLKIKLGTAVLPYISQFVGTLESKGLPILQEFGDWFTKDGLPGLENFAGGLATTVEKSGAFQSVLHTIDDVLPTVKQDLGDVVGAAKQLLPPTLDLVKNFSEWIDKSGILTDGLHILGGSVTTVANVCAPLIQDLSNLFGWLNKTPVASRLVRDGLLGIGAAIAGMKIVDLIGNIAKLGGNLLNAGKNALEFAGNIKDHLVGALDTLHGKATSAGTSVTGLGTDAEVASGEVRSLGTASKTTAGEETLMGNDAALAGGKVGAMGAESEAAGGASGIGGLTGAMGGLKGGLLALIPVLGTAIAEMQLAMWLHDSGIIPDVNKITGGHDTNPSWITHKPPNAHALGIFNNPVGHIGLVGERGPELMYVPKGASIFPNSETQHMLGQSVMNQGQITVHVHPPDISMDGWRLTHQMMPHIHRAIGSNVNSTATW